MTGDRYRIQVDDAYVAALGRAVFDFAVLECNAVYCCERLKPGYLRKVERKKKTAGGIAGDLLAHLRLLPADDPWRACWHAATRFDELVETRNPMLHAKPGQRMAAGNASSMTATTGPSPRTRRRPISSRRAALSSIYCCTGCWRPDQTACLRFSGHSNSSSSGTGSITGTWMFSGAPSRRARMAIAGPVIGAIQRTS